MTTAATEPCLSLVVPTHGRSDLIRGLLDTLHQQTLAPDRFEVVAVDDGSPEPVEIDPKDHPFSVRLLRQANAGPGAARNLAFDHCRAPLALILNDDAVPAPELLEGHVQAHASCAGKTAVLGSFHFAPDVLDSPFVRLLDRTNLLFDFPGLRPGGLHDWRFFWTCNLSLPLAALRSVGGFDSDRFREAIVEDVELGYRLEQEGWQILHRDDLVCHHRHRLSPRAYFERMVRLGVNLVRMWKKHRDPAILWMGEQGLGSFLSDCQLRYEAHRGPAERLLERLERLELEGLGRALPDGLLEEIEAPVRMLALVPFARGVILEGAGYDPENYVRAAPAPGALTSIVIVSYDALEKTRRCLEALREADDPEHPVEIVVVDNGSSDGSVEYLAAQPDVTLLAAGENLGAPRARNHAIPATNGEWIVFMDNDAVVTPGWLARLRYHADVDPKVGCVCPLSDRASHGQEIPYAGGDSLEAIRAFADQVAGRERRKARYGLLFSSFCVLVRRSVIARIGGFDTRFSPWGFEDDDFSLRAQLAGFRVRVALDVFVRHEAYSGAKLERNERLLRRNWRRFAEKWGTGRLVPEYGDYQLLSGALARTWSDGELHVPLDAGLGG